MSTHIQSKSDKIISKVTTVIAVVVLVVLLIWAGKTLFGYLKYEETNDAQIDEYINPVAARVSGYIKEVRFEENQETYYNDLENVKNTDAIFDELSKELKKVNEDLVFYFSKKNKNNIRELTISADGIEKIFPAVEKLIKKAPKLKNWKFNAFRQPILGDDLVINYDDLEIGYSDIFYRSQTQDGKLGIELNIRNFDGKGSTQNAIYILLDNLIGEYNVVKKIDWIEWVKLNENDTTSLKPLIQLREEIDK
ncbi:MAG: hypothetical protein EOO44_19360 [Flavobacterium sp.]|nr:MAG: hypothetical protein EOO44_19360 [Flavobacterium sp.]